MSSLTVNYILAGMIVIIAYLINIPTVAWSYIRLVQHRQKSYFVKRGFSILVIHLSLLSIYSSIVPIEAFSHGFNLFHLSWEISFIVNLSLVYAIVIFIVIRFWIQFIDVKRSQDRKKWRQIIDPTFKKHSWVVKYYTYLAHRKYIFILGFVIYLLFMALIFITLYLNGRTLATYISWILTVFLLICASILMYFIWQVNDYWYIKRELRTYSFLIIGLCLYSVVVYFIIHSRVIIVLSICLGIVIETVIMQIVATHAIIHWNEKRQKLLSKQYENASVMEELQSFLATEKGYEEIMLHLTREFCSGMNLYLFSCWNFVVFLREFIVCHGIGSFSRIIAGCRTNDISANISSISYTS